jgi:cell division protein WhiA
LSFSSIVKNELCRTEVNEKCCLISELAAVIRLNGIAQLIKTEGKNIKIVTENAAFARKVFSLIRNIYNISPEIIIRKSKKLKKHTLYILIITWAMGTNYILNSVGINTDLEVNNDILKRLLKKNCCRKSFLRGAFLAGGSISDPEKTYHLEITTHTLALAKIINTILIGFNLNAKIIKRKENYIVYIKEGENIVDFLNIIGAHSALLNLENVRILKGMRNDVNRIVNCETANLDKTVNAAFRQIENIKYIRDTIGFEHLPISLSEIARLRLDYRDASLKELGEMLRPNLGKSGVNHRLHKLDEIAESTRNLKGEV